MRGACIDIGSNTTRLLVADCDRGRLAEVHQDRQFTQIVHGKLPGIRKPTLGEIHLTTLREMGPADPERELNR